MYSGMVEFDVEACAACNSEDKVDKDVAGCES